MDNMENENIATDKPYRKLRKCTSGYVSINPLRTQNWMLVISVIIALISWRAIIAQLLWIADPM